MYKNVKKLIIILTVYLAGTFLVNTFGVSGISSVIANQLTVDSVNGGNVEFITQNSYLRWYANAQNYVLFGTLFLALAMFWGSIRDALKGKGSTVAVAIAALCMLSSCRKPYQKPVYTEVENNVTAYVIPLEGDTGNQVKLNSKEFYEKHKVSIKRIEIPTRWNQTGRLIGDGEWIPTVAVLQVNRSPVTREWQVGTKGTTNTDQAIWVESSDSVGFSMGFNCTGFIREEDTSTFLYWYSSGSLATVMDSEIRGRVQQVAAEECAKLPLDKLRDKKNDIAASVRADIVPFFAERGITITTVGMFGGMTYENTAIQNSIDNVFVAQQEKNVALAKYEAQVKENERVVLEAEGTAKQRQIQSESEAKAITALTQAVAQGGENYLALKALEVQMKQTEKWNGALPTVSSGVSPLIDAGAFINKK